MVFLPSGRSSQLVDLASGTLNQLDAFPPSGTLRMSACSASGTLTALFCQAPVVHRHAGLHSVLVPRIGSPGEGHWVRLGKTASELEVWLQMLREMTSHPGYLHMRQATAVLVLLSRIALPNGPGDSIEILDDIVLGLVYLLPRIRVETTEAPRQSHTVFWTMQELHKPHVVV